VKRSPRGIHRPCRQSGWAVRRAVTGYIGVFTIPTGFRFEKPRPGNPYGAWAAGDHRGFWGFISTPGIFFKNDHSGYLNHQYPLKKYFQRPKKTIKTPNTPFSLSDRGRCFLALIATNILTLTSTAFNAAVSGLMGTALGIRTVSSMMHSKIAGQDKAIKKHKATATRRKAATKKFGTRLASRTKRVAAKSIAAIPAESIPFVGVAVLFADTGYELYVACETFRDLDQLYVDLGMEDEVQKNAMHSVCVSELPALWTPSP
jgi:hypothetical protein